MTVFELVAALGGEIVCNEARVRRDGKWLVLAKVVNNVMTVTEIGQRLLDAVQDPPAVEVEAPKPVIRRGRPRKTDEVGLG